MQDDDVHDCCNSDNGDVAVGARVDLLDSEGRPFVYDATVLAVLHGEVHVDGRHPMWPIEQVRLHGDNGDVTAGFEAKHKEANAKFWDDLEAELEDEKAERKALRHASCGKHNCASLRSETGRQTWYRYLCDLWRAGDDGKPLCQFCFDRRAKEERDRLERAKAEGYILHITKPMGKAAADRLRRKLSKSQYRRYPTAGGYVFVNIAGEGDVLVIDDIDWGWLAATPAPKRLSGDLGKEKKMKDDTPTVNILEIVVDNNTTLEQKTTALQAAVERTKDLSPKTLEEVQEACDVRQNALLEEYKKLGVTILKTRVARRKCRLNRIGWKPYTDKMTKQDARGPDSWVDDG